MNIENQTSSELNALWNDELKALLTENAKTKLLQFARETDQNEAGKLRKDVKIVIAFLMAVIDERKRNKASVQQENKPPPAFPAPPPASPQEIKPPPAFPAAPPASPQENKPPPAFPAAPSMSAAPKAPEAPKAPSIFSNLFGGKPRTFRHRAYYNNTLRNFR